MDRWDLLRLCHPSDRLDLMVRWVRSDRMGRSDL